MKYRSFFLRQYDTSSFAELHPSFDYSFRDVAFDSSERTVGGSLNTFRFDSTNYKFDIPLTNVSSETKNLVNLWWRNQTKLAITYGDSATPLWKSCAVKIKNRIEPFGVFTRGQASNFEGILFLSSVESAGIFSGGPFVLDDAVLGLLDQTYNTLS